MAAESQIEVFTALLGQWRTVNFHILAVTLVTLTPQPGRSVLFQFQEWQRLLCHVMALYLFISILFQRFALLLDLNHCFLQ